MPLPPWPPELSPEQLEELTSQAKTYALSHGLLYLPVSAPGTQQPPLSSAIHAPFALFPTPFPRKAFEEAQSMQQVYNVLYARVASDEAFLDRVLSADTAVGRVDEFVGQLWRIWKEVRTEGFAQPLQLGVFRSDYLLHEEENGLGFKQVEFNTVASSFGALSQKVDGLHRHLMRSTGYFQCSDILDESNFPVNETLSEVVKGLAQAHKAYLHQLEDPRRPSSQIQILFVVQPNERNVFDQRFLEYELLHRHNIRVVRRTLGELETHARLEDGRTRTLLLPLLPPAAATMSLDGLVEISVVYFRAGYTPTDYPTPREFETRKMLERSRAIKCPSIALQLAGSKKIQAMLSQPGVLEHFVLSDRWRPPSLPVSPSQVKGNDPNDVFLSGEETVGVVGRLRASWMEMWGLEEDGGVERARREALGLVLKPQREGGGNNVYRSHILPFLDRLPEEEREAWIAMALIRVPKGVKNWLVRSGVESVRSNVVSELGVFGWALFGYEQSGEDNTNGRKKMRLEEGSGGYLLRTKGENSDEGGVAAGFSVLDSVVLVGE